MTKTIHKEKLETKKIEKKSTFPIKKHEVKPSSRSKDDAKKGGLKTKDSIINGILRRWWYCMEDWPPVDYDYNAKLLENGLRQVDFQKWKSEEEKNEAGSFTCSLILYY